MVRSIYTKELAKAVAKNAKGKERAVYHVIRFQIDKWGVVSRGSLKAMKTFSTKSAAVSFAMQRAVSKHVDEVVIHDFTGGVEKRISGLNNKVN